MESYSYSYWHCFLCEFARRRECSTWKWKFCYYIHKCHGVQTIRLSLSSSFYSFFFSSFAKQKKNSNEICNLFVFVRQTVATGNENGSNLPSQSDSSYKCAIVFDWNLIQISRKLLQYFKLKKCALKNRERAKEITTKLTRNHSQIKDGKSVAKCETIA